MAASVRSRELVLDRHATKRANGGASSVFSGACGSGRGARPAVWDRSCPFGSRVRRQSAAAKCR